MSGQAESGAGLALTLDTSLTANVAFTDGARVLGTASEDAPRRHAEDLGAMVEGAARDAGLLGPLKDLGVTSVCVGTGPGSFTAVRAGLSFGRAVARGLGVPAYGIPSLDGFARNVFDRHPTATTVTVITDARRREVFWARYSPLGGDDVEATVPPTVGPLEDALAGAEAETGGSHLVAVDPALLGDVPRGEHVIPVEVDASTLARIAASRLAHEGALPVEPIYLRRPDVHVPKPRG